MSLGRTLKRLRESNGINQDKVAKALFVSRQTVSHWERDVNRPSIEMLQIISELLNAPFCMLVEDLLAADRDEPPGRKACCPHGAQTEKAGCAFCSLRGQSRKDWDDKQGHA